MKTNGYTRGGTFSAQTFGATCGRCEQVITNPEFSASLTSEDLTVMHVNGKREVWTPGCGYCGAKTLVPAKFYDALS